MMNIINTVLGTPLGYLMYLCYQVIGNYGWAIIVFTLLTKVVLFPISLSSQKNSIKMVKLQPQLDELKERYGDNPNLMMEEQKKLYKKEKYSVAIGILPMLLQIPIILGLINVMYNPLQHLIRVSGDTLTALGEKTAQVLGITELGYGGELQIIHAIQENAAAFEGIAESAVLQRILSFDLFFAGIDLAQVPSFTNITPVMIVPVLSGVSALILCVSQNYMNVLQREQGLLSKWGMTIFLTAFSTYFAFIVPGGIGLYWTATNLLSILVMVVCNWVYNPKKYIDYENRTQKVKLTKEEKDEQKRKKALEKKREKEDIQKFYAEEKQLVFYSESSGFYKYFKGLIEYITEHSDIVVHYVTSDINDQIFQNANKQIKSYYVGGNALIPFMMKMEADMVIMTMPDLNQYHIKRSLVRKDTEYIYLDHGMTSFHLMLREGALDHYDTIFCYGPNHIEEVRQTEEAYELPAKKLIKTGYGLLDELLKQVEQIDIKENEVKKILIAPSWQKDNIMEYCLDELLEPLLGKEYQVIVRPHPEFVKRFSGKMKQILDKYKDRMDEKFRIETDFSSNESVYTADLVITDWSSIAQEFSYATKKPSLFINTPMKIMNPEYKKIKAVPLDISLRDEIGVSVDKDNLGELEQIVGRLFEQKEEYQMKIQEILEHNIYNIGESDRVAGEYVIGQLRGE